MYAHLLAALQWRLVDVEFDVGAELKVAHGRQTDGSWARWEARARARHGQGCTARGRMTRGMDRSSLEKDGYLEGIIIVNS